MANLQRILNALFIYVLCGILLSGYAYQFVKHEEPCPLCLLQRLGMLGVIMGLLMNLRFGIKTEYYGLSILSAVIGRIVSLRQISLHVCPQFPTFGEPVLGFDLYVWAFIAFTCSIVAIAILLILFGFTRHEEFKPHFGGWEKLAFALPLILVLGNIVTSLLDCGLTGCD